MRKAEVVEDFLPALLQFVDQVGVIQNRDARMRNRMARKFISALGQRVQRFPGNGVFLICGDFVRGRWFERSLTYLRVSIVDDLIGFGKVFLLVICFARPGMVVGGPLIAKKRIAEARSKKLSWFVGTVAVSSTIALVGLPMNVPWYREFGI